MPLNFRDMQDEVNSIAKFNRTKSAQLDITKRAINETIQDIHGRYDWNWSKDRSIVQTVIDKTAGTVSISSGGTAVTGSGTSFASGDKDKYIQFSNNNDWYKISSQSSTTALVIEAPFTGSSALSAGTYTIRQFFYSISATEKILSMKESRNPRKLRFQDPKTFDMFHPFSDQTGTPRKWIPFGETSDGDLQFTLWPYADEVYNFDVSRKLFATELSGDTDEPDLPPKWRNVIVTGAVLRVMPHLALLNKDFGTSLLTRQESRYERMIDRMLSDAEPDTDYNPGIRSSDTLLLPPGPRLPEGLSIPED